MKHKVTKSEKAERRLINKFVIPNRYHFAQKGTVARVVTDYGKSYYVQVSDNEIKPDWTPMALVLEAALEKQFENEKFLENIMALYETSRNRDELSHLDTSIEELISQ